MRRETEARALNETGTRHRLVDNGILEARMGWVDKEKDGDSKSQDVSRGQALICNDNSKNGSYRMHNQGSRFLERRCEICR